MCGRYRLSRRKQILAEYFDVKFDDLDWEPRYNIAPTQPVLAVRRSEPAAPPSASLLRWGLIPSWAADPNVGASMINARAETAASKPSFRDALQSQRCLIPADGFYEWKRSGRERQPFCFEVNSGDIFAFAGIWDRWRGPSGNTIETCSILTTTPNAITATVHDRMPVILHSLAYDIWLDPRVRNLETVSELLRPYDAAQMRCFPVSTHVNQVSNDGEDCSRQVEITEEQPSLFS